MNLHEYQGKQLFAEYNIPVSKGKIIFSPEEVINACNEIGGTKWVVKTPVSYTHLPLPTIYSV